MRRICIVTSTRSEYGLLRPLINEINKEEYFDLKVVATGMHLSPEFGCTYKQIEDDGIKIDEKIEILMSSDSEIGVSKTMGMAMVSFAEYFKRNKMDLLVLLGDRYEAFAIASVATIFNIPIAHIHGGEVTEGAYDDAFRHSITKMSYLHFTSNDLHRKRVIQLGENPERVFDVGAIGLDNISTMKLLSKEDLEQSISFKLDEKFGLVTFHPVTLEGDDVKRQFEELLTALKEFKDMKFIITKANSDSNGRIINKMIDEFVKENSEKTISFVSMGQLRYLSAMKYCSAVIGNSSSGIIEAPSFNVPTVNIGNRQSGRLQGKTIINCSADSDEITNSIKKAISKEFTKKIQAEVNPYGNGRSAKEIIRILKEFKKEDIDLRKGFYDLDTII